jgi:hypothetical protein
VALLFFLIYLLLWKEVPILSIDSLEILPSIQEGIKYLVVMIQIPLQIVFLSEVYKISILRVVLIHLIALVVIGLGLVIIGVTVFTLII